MIRTTEIIVVAAVALIGCDMESTDLPKRRAETAVVDDGIARVAINAFVCWDDKLEFEGTLSNLTNDPLCLAPDTLTWPESVKVELPDRELTIESEAFLSVVVNASELRVLDPLEEVDFTLAFSFEVRPKSDDVVVDFLVDSVVLPLNQEMIVYFALSGCSHLFVRTESGDEVELTTVGAVRKDVAARAFVGIDATAAFPFAITAPQ